MQLSKLEKVHLRDVWSHEALKFANWLTKSESRIESPDPTQPKGSLQLRKRWQAVTEVRKA